MFEISEPHLLYTLLKALLALKFDCDPESAAEYCGSPHIEEVCNRLYDAVIASYRMERKEGPAHRLELSRTLTGRNIEVDAFRGHLRVLGVAPWWRKASIEHKDKYIRTFMSPYTVDDELMQSLIIEADNLVVNLA
jgi:hypothetical protein